MSTYPPSAAGSRTHFKAMPSLFLQWIAVSTVIVYIAFSPIYLVGSLTIGDLWLAGALFLVLWSRRFWKCLAHFFRSGYLLLSFLLSAAMLLATINAPSVPDNLKFIAQFMTILWVLIPLVAVGVAQMESPLRFLEIFSWLSLIFFAVGVVLQFGFGMDGVLYANGPGRFTLRFNAGALQMSALCLSTACLFKGREFRWRYLVMLLGAVMPVIFNASRSGFVTIALIIGVAALMSLRRWRGLLLAVVVGGGMLWLLSSTAIQDTLGIAVRTEYFMDEARLDSAQAAWRTLSQDWTNWMFGVGWGNSGKGAMSLEIVVHNVLLQVLTEAGILTMGLLCGWLFLPVIWVVRLKRSHEIERTFVILGSVSVWMSLLLHAVSCERAHWLGFAILMGVAGWLRADRKLDQPGNVGGVLKQ